MSFPARMQGRGNSIQNLQYAGSYYLKFYNNWHLIKVFEEINVEKHYNLSFIAMPWSSRL